jgi:hypothetical protein
VSLHEIALRTPRERHPDADKCPTCEWHDAMAQQAFQDSEGVDRSALTDVRVLRRKHAESGECLAVVDDQDHDQSRTPEELRRREEIISRETRQRRTGGAAMAVRRDRAQSGMYDSQGDGHPPREHYLPAHSECEKTPETTADDAPEVPEEVAE